ncbi:MAG: peptidoglycan-associated lipoprotein [Burkholderiales bacterium]|jgi:peptidoglycan-associated lipoprotein|nr:peptidoglycan-associated lipoprotein [Burkholderiales bacterium]
MLKKLLVAAAVSAAIAACSSTKEPEPAPEPTPVASAPVVASAPEVASAPVVSNHNSVYFGFNQYDIKDSYTDIVKANAEHLAATADAKVQVQGNTDDIGSEEYNLALAQKRANAVKKALIAAGAAKGQIEAVSYGKLKPKYPNDTPASRAQNRRSDIEYKSGQPNGYSQDSNGLPMVDGSFYTGTVVEGVE